MLITKPEVHPPEWSHEGVGMHVCGFYYAHAVTPPSSRGATIDGEKPIFFTVDLTGDQEEPDVEVSYYIQQVPGGTGLVSDWIEEYGLVNLWKGKLAEYKETLAQIDLPGVKLRDYPLGYTVFIEAPGDDYDLPPLQLDVQVLPWYTSCVLSLPDAGALPYNLCDYDIDLPITMESLKASAKGPLLQYLRALEERETC